MISRLIILFLFIHSTIFSQTAKTKAFYASIKKYDLRKLWCADSFLVLDGDKIDNNDVIHSGPGMFSFPEPLGFIGNDYQRFYIHYLSVTKSKTNTYQYNVTGKTRVKNNICNFKGTITIKEAKLSTESYDSNYKQGYVSCIYNLYEDSSLPYSGKLTGKLETDFMLDKRNKIYYDVIMLVADGYSNNQCTGTWKSYKTKTVKKCNWGDFRIPDSRELDGGAGEFMVNKQYLKNGWQSYMERTDTTKEEQWWKDK